MNWTISTGKYRGHAEADDPMSAAVTAFRAHMPDVALGIITECLADQPEVDPDDKTYYVATADALRLAGYDVRESDVPQT